MSTPSHRRIAVLGATPAGLAVAMRLAAKRHDVTIVDASPHAGGRLLGYEVADTSGALAFDPGVITLPAVFRDLFLKTGGALEDEVDLQPVAHGRRYHFAAGTVLTLPGVGVGVAAQAVGDALGADARAQWTAFMADAADVWAANRQEAWTQKSADAIIAGTRAAPVLARRRDGLRATSARILRDARLRAVADDVATSLGADAALAPASLATRPYVELAFGMWQVGGGRRRLADALARRTHERGVGLRLGTAVVGDRTTSDGGHALDLADGTTLDVDTVVDAASSASLYAQSLTDDPAVVPPYRRRMHPLRRTDARTAARLDVLVAVDGDDGEPPAALTTWFGTDPARAAHEALTGRLPADPTIRACVPTPEPTHEGSGPVPWTLSVTVPRASADLHSSSATHAYAARILDLLAARGTDLRPHSRILGVHLADLSG